MALLTRKKYDEILREFVAGDEINDELLNLVETLRNDFAEREGYLGQSYDEELDYYDYKTAEVKEEVNDELNNKIEELESDKKALEDKYNDLVKKYKDRFFGIVEEVVEEKEEYEDDGSDITFEDLFETKEDK